MYVEKGFLRKILSLLLSFMLLYSQSGFAQVAGELNIAGHLSRLHSQIIQDKFRPPHLRYLDYNNLNNNFRLYLDKGDQKDLEDHALESSTRKLLEYFFIGITLPNESFWVNLRPDSPDNIIDGYLVQTDIGKILLEADVQLKKDTAQMTNPQTAIGKLYWDKLYKKAEELLGYENITIPTLVRPWIVPGEIIIRENQDSAYIYKATLKVMLEEDYLKDSVTYNFKDPRLKALNEYSSQLLIEYILPILNKEVNSSKKYAGLRQVYYSLILSQWFKKKFYGKGGLYSSLIDKRDLTNLTSKENWSKTDYFRQYQASFKDGEYNLKEPMYTPFGQSVRSYFSGGIALTKTEASSAVVGNTAFDAIIRHGIAVPLEKVTVAASSPGQVTVAASPVVASYSQTSPFRAFGNIRQKIWVDGLTFNMLKDGTFEELVREHGINGVTTNPTLIKAYLNDERVKEKARKLAEMRDSAGKYVYSEEQIYFELIKGLALQVISIFNKYNVDGKFSVELDPENADKVNESVEEAMRWTGIDPEHIMVKVPATEAGYQVIEKVTSGGGNVNVTLIFSPEQYRKVAEAYIRGLERAAEAGLDLSKIYSVASFFVSRWDVRLAKKIPEEAHGWVANSIAIHTYNTIFKSLFESDRFGKLRDKGARPQDFLLASTGSKKDKFPQEVQNHYPDDVYVSAVQGPNVVNTLPYATIKSLLRQQIQPRNTIIENIGKANEVLGLMSKAVVGFDLESIGAELLSEGRKSFEKDAAIVKSTIAEIVKQARTAVSPASPSPNPEIDRLQLRISDLQRQLQELNHQAYLAAVQLQKDFDNRKKAIQQTASAEIRKGTTPEERGSIGESLERLLADLDAEYQREQTKIDNRFNPERADLEIKIADLTKQLQQLLSQESSTTSSPVQENAARRVDANSPLAPGGIDFRQLPSITQPMLNSSFFKAPQRIIPTAELDVVWSQIQKMVRGGIIPSGERLWEYAYSCCQQGSVQEITKVLACIADILRLEEEQAQTTEAGLKELLVLLESGKFNPMASLDAVDITDED